MIKLSRYFISDFNSDININNLALVIRNCLYSKIVIFSHK